MPLVRWSCGARRAAGVVALAGLAASQSAVAAAPVSLELHWDAPAECPGAAQVRADIERLTGRRWEAGAGDTMIVDAHVARDGLGQWAVVLAIAHPSSAPGTRRVEGGSCREVADAAAVIVALAVGAPPPAPAPVAAVAPPVARAAAVADVAAPAPRLRFGLAVMGGVAVAALPAAAPGVSVGGSVGFGRNAIELRASAWRAQDAALSPASGAHVALVAAAVRYCRALVGRTLELGACAGVEVGGFRAEGFGLRQNQTGVARWLAPELAVRALWAVVPHVQLALEAGALVPVLRDRFVVDDVQVYRPRPVDGRALAGARVEFR